MSHNAAAFLETFKTLFSLFVKKKFRLNTFIIAVLGENRLLGCSSAIKFAVGF